MTNYHHQLTSPTHFNHNITYIFISFNIENYIIYYLASVFFVKGLVMLCHESNSIGHFFFRR